jgi:GNAT superfamily N-acetyltransferase
MADHSEVAVEYREADVSDLAGLLELFVQLKPDDEKLPHGEALEIWGKIRLLGNIKYFVALEGEKPVSTCNITIIPNLTRSGRPFGIIENVITDPAFRKRGIGRKVLEMAIEHARRERCYKILLLSSMNLTAAHSFYASLGFSGDTKKGFELRL